MENRLKHPELEAFFQDADYIDVKRIEARTGLRAFIAGMLSYYPWWLVILYRARQILVGILGLVKHEKPEVMPSFRSEDISFTPGDPASFFIVRKAEEERYWISETPEDKHLTAYFGVTSKKLESGLTRFEVITAIRYRHWTGPVYFNLIRPFHHLVLWSMMKAGAAYKSKPIA
jgi:hypothetical protein